eukprot:m.13510 g.13510  ORF g.13510 m.13510 type:complete len:346 (-) comp5950_c0_seq1:556-1593(-)
MSVDKAFGSAGRSPVWYHGRLSRSDVEQKLTGMPDGTFIIRDSTSAAGNFVLSVSELGATSHYKIARTADDRFEVGQQLFADLPEVIEFYRRHNLEATTLSVPLPLDHKFEGGTLEENFICSATALYNYNARDTEDLSFRKGETLRILKKHEKEWWTAQSEKTLQIGCIPANYVQTINDPADLYETIAQAPRQAASEASSKFARTDSLMRGATLAPEPTPTPVTLPRIAETPKLAAQDAKNALDAVMPRVTQTEVPDERPKFIACRAAMDRNARGFDKTALSFKVSALLSIHACYRACLHVHSFLTPCIGFTRPVYRTWFYVGGRHHSDHPQEPKWSLGRIHCGR